MTELDKAINVIERFEAEIDTTAAYIVETFEWLGLGDESMDTRIDLTCEIADKLKDCFAPWCKPEPWTESTNWPRADWQADVASGDTSLGYEDWVAHNIKSAKAEYDALAHAEARAHFT